MSAERHGLADPATPRAESAGRRDCGRESPRRLGHCLAAALTLGVIGSYRAMVHCLPFSSSCLHSLAQTLSAQQRQRTSTTSTTSAASTMSAAPDIPSTAMLGELVNVVHHSGMDATTHHRLKICLRTFIDRYRNAHARETSSNSAWVRIIHLHLHWAPAPEIICRGPGWAASPDSPLEVETDVDLSTLRVHGEYVLGLSGQNIRSSSPGTQVCSIEVVRTC